MFKQLPNYEINETGPPHMKTFSVTCTVSTFTAYGDGKSKKQAKNEAALKMWEMIHEHIFTETINCDSQNIKLENEQSLPMNLQSTLKNSLKEKLDEKNVENSQKKDNEIVQANSTNGQIFSVTKVEIQDKNESDDQLIPDSSIKTKEINKTDDSAKNIKPVSSSDEKVTVIPPSDEKDNNVNSISSSNEKKNNVKEVIVGKINNTFEKLQNTQNSPLLKFMQMKANANKALISDGHFKKSFSNEIRELVLKQVINLIDKITNVDEITEKIVFDARQSFSELLKPLKLIYKHRKLETKSSKIIIHVQISTNPDIHEIGIADNHHQAEINGMKQILHLLTKLM